ncbi:GroES-like protein [Aulographum hederae CBS 113979]|uniref:GroES-like protein n=1 Tax=Aulographum hederae CBS 113979 TaxID=1176131 RepID=A0A6G1GLP4_9PEZI|nr:GroES-like protein [Aulographum hederae CBS 113979]
MAIEGIPDTMLAAQIIEFNKPYKVHQIPTPQFLQPHDLLVKTAVASLCHTDSMVQAGIMGTSLPCVGSHEGAGTVVAVGEAVQSFKKGDRIMSGIPFRPCGSCKDCQDPKYRNYRQYCAKEDHIGVTTDGAFAEYHVADARTSSHLPDSVSFETAAPLSCAGRTVWRSVLQTELKSAEWLAIVGSGGGLGHLGIHFAKALGLKVIAIDARDEGLEMSKKGDVVIDARKGIDHVREEVFRITGGEGSDAAINLSEADTAAATACAATKMHGLVVQIAQPKEVSVPFEELIFRDIRIRGSLLCTEEESKRMLDVVAEHNISVKTNPVHGLHELPKLVELAHSGKMQGKGIVIIDEEQTKKQEDSQKQ